MPLTPQQIEALQAVRQTQRLSDKPTAAQLAYKKDNKEEYKAGQRAMEDVLGDLKSANPYPILTPEHKNYKKYFQQVRNDAPRFAGPEDYTFAKFDASKDYQALNKAAKDAALNPVNDLRQQFLGENYAGGPQAYAAKMAENNQRSIQHDAAQDLRRSLDVHSTGMKKGGKVKKMASGGMTSKASPASSRGDGIAQRGKTKGRMC